MWTESGSRTVGRGAGTGREPGNGRRSWSKRTRRRSCFQNAWDRTSFGVESETWIESRRMRKMMMKKGT